MLQSILFASFLSFHYKKQSIVAVESAEFIVIANFPLRACGDATASKQIQRQNISNPSQRCYGNKPGIPPAKHILMMTFHDV